MLVTSIPGMWLTLLLRTRASRGSISSHAWLHFFEKLETSVKCAGAFLFAVVDVPLRTMTVFERYTGLPSTSSTTSCLYLGKSESNLRISKSVILT